jgi:peptide/nickel transport system permease protein
MTLGTAYGLVAGYVGGRLDNAMMRILDGFLSIPRVLILIAVLTLHPVPLTGLIILLGATGWFGVSRLVRAETISAKKLDYVAAARALGASDVRTLWRHLLPNVISPVIVAATLAVGNVISLEAGLSYLGIGAKAPTPSWGSIFNEGIGSFTGNWWVALFPGIAIVATVLAFNVLGDALRDVLDPRQLHLALPSPEPTTSARSTSD